MKFALKALSLAVVAAASTFTYADEATSVHSVSGNIGVFLVITYVVLPIRLKMKMRLFKVV